QRPEHPKASYEDYCDGKHHVEKLVPPSRCRITTKQQPNRCRMIVEDQNVSDCFATYGDRPRQDCEDFLRSSRCCIRQPVGSNIHHSLSSFRTPTFQKICVSCAIRWGAARRLFYR